MLSFVTLTLLMMAAEPATAEISFSTPNELAAAIASRPANEGRVGTMNFRLTNARGSTRTREALLMHSERPEVVRIAIYFQKPSMIAETAFLSFDHSNRDDENWLYLPATQRVRRLPASERGDYFMGTDLTYGDIQDNFKFPLDEWTFAFSGHETHRERRYPVLVGTAKNQRIVEQTGYSSFRALVDVDTQFPVIIEYADADGDPLKRVEVTKIERVGGAWTAMRFAVDQLQTGHRSEVYFTDMRYVPDLDDSVFDPEALAYGPDL